MLHTKFSLLYALTFLKSGRRCVFNLIMIGESAFTCAPSKNDAQRIAPVSTWPREHSAKLRSVNFR